MPLSPESRRKDKDRVTVNRIPKLFLDDALLDYVRKRYPHVRVQTYRGKPYVDIRDFKSCGFIRREGEKRSREVYAFALIRFLKWKNALPDDLVEDYRMNPERAAEDISAFILEMRGRLSENYLGSIVYAVRLWLLVNGVEVRSEVLRKKYRVKLRPSSPLDTPPTRDELRRIFLASNPVWRAVFSFLSATGLRPSEAITLRIGDLKPHPYDAAAAEEVITVTVPGTLTKKDFSYTTFAHPECAKLLADFLRKLEGRGIDVEDPDAILFYNPRSKTGFYRVNTVEVAWNRVLDRLGLDDRIVYPARRVRSRHLYTLRKFFRTNLETAGVPYGAVEAMLGHKNWYVRFTVDKLREFYKRGMWSLMVLTSVPSGKVAEIVERAVRPLREEILRLKKERENEFIRSEAEARELVRKLAAILRRHPELLRELLGEL